MKQLLLILSGILFLCSCEDMEPTMQGTLERLEDNSATIKTSLPDSISSNDYDNPSIPRGEYRATVGVTLSVVE